MSQVSVWTLQYHISFQTFRQADTYDFIIMYSFYKLHTKNTYKQIWELYNYI